MVVQHTMSWFWDLKEHLAPETVTRDLRHGFWTLPGQKMWKNFGDSVWTCSCISFTMYYLQRHLPEMCLQSSIFAFVQEKHNMYLQARHKKGQQSQFMNKQTKKRLMAGFYNALVMSRNAHHTYNAQWEVVRFPSSTYVLATHGRPISNRLFWMSCLPSMVMQS